MTEQSSRTLQLLALLQSGRLIQASELSRRMEVSTRTLRRDIETLQGLGYNVESRPGPTGGYRLRPGQTVPPMLLNEEQVVAVTLALQAWESGVEGLDDAAGQALASLRSVLPHRLRARIDSLPLTRVERDDPVDRALFETVLACVRNRQTTRFLYKDYDAERIVEPHELVQRGRHWYLIAWDPSHRGWRTFRLDRMAGVRSGRHFTRRDLPRKAADMLAPARPLPCRGTARLFTPPEDVLPWVDGGDVSVDQDGNCIVTADSWTWGGLVAWFALFDVEFQLLDPAPLVEAGQALAHRLALMEET